MRNSKRVKIVAGGTAVLFGVGVAFAAWTSTGEGTGSATANSEGLDNLVVSGGGATDLFPTGSVEETVTVTNNNPYPVALDDITFVDATVPEADEDCNPASVTAALKDGEVLDQYISPSGTSEGHVFVVSMDADADEGCKGSVFTLNYSASGHSVAVQTQAP